MTIVFISSTCTYELFKNLLVKAGDTFPQISARTVKGTYGFLIHDGIYRRLIKIRDEEKLRHEISIILAT
jgi:hypothetical protein